MFRERVALHDGGFVHASLVAREASAHALPLHKLVVPLDGAALSCRHEGEHLVCRHPVLVAADVPQAMSADGPTLAIFVPAVTAGHAFHARARVAVIGGRDGEALSRLAAAMIERPALAGAAEAMATVARVLLERSRLDRRIHVLLSRLEEGDPFLRPPLGVLAAQTHVSASRLSHLFAGNTGVALRSWLSFRRVFHSVRQLVRVSDLGALASATGFADQPHLTRAWGRSFGRTPTEIRSVFLQDPPAPRR